MNVATKIKDIYIYNANFLTTIITANINVGDENNVDVLNVSKLMVTTQTKLSRVGNF